MSSKLKALCLATMAALAVSAVAAGGAFAEGHHEGGHFTSEAETTFLTGEDHNGSVELKYGEQTVTCEESIYHGHMEANTETSVTITPTYNKCQTGGGSTAHVDMTGCDYTFTIGDYAHDHNEVHLTCPEPGIEPHVEITVPFFSDCTLTFTQGTYTGVSYTDPETANPSDITADVTVPLPHVTRTGNSLCGPAEGEGELAGEVTLQGYKDEAHKEQVGITATGEFGTQRPE